MNATSLCYTFGPYALYPEERLLLRGGRPVPLQPKAFELLSALVAGEGRLMRRDALMKALWPDSFVEEINLTVNVSLLRKSLGEAPGGGEYIVTVPKQGYRFGTPISRGDTGTLSAEIVETKSIPAENVALNMRAVADSVPSAPSLVSPAPVPVPTTSAGATWLKLGGAIAGAVLLLLVIGFGWKRWLALRAGGPTEGVPHTLAVLPFTVLSTDADGQYLGLGLTDALITRLGSQHTMAVRSFAAVRRFAGTADPLATGRALQADAILEGTVQRVAGQSRVSVRLLRVDTGRTQWTATFDESASNAFALEDAISQKLAAALTLQLTSDEQRRLAAPQTRNSEAYDLYTRGRVAWNARSVESVRRSLVLFQQAIDADPQFAAAYAGLADAYILAGSYGNSFLAPSISAPKAKEALQRALALDPDSAEAHTSLAYLHLIYDWDWNAAEAEFQEAIRLNPKYLTAHHWYSHQMTAQGRTAESHAESEQTMELGPIETVANEHMAWHHLFAREYDIAITQAKKAVEMDPGFVQSHRVLGMALMYKGDFAPACAEFDIGVKLSHEDPVALSYQARCLALSGHKPQAKAILAQLETAAKERYVSAAEISAVFAALGERESALRWLQRAAEEHASALVYINVDPIFDPLRKEVVFSEVVRLIHLNPDAPGPYTAGLNAADFWRTSPKMLN